MIVSVDFDGTLALGNASHISLAQPNYELIERLRLLKSTINPTIKIVTARGSKGNLTIAEKESRYLLHIQNFLKAYDIPYDEISFNKEYASLYIDDMAIRPDEWFSGLLSEHTKNKIIFTDESVIKFCKTALFEFEWYKKASGFNTPNVLFCNDELIITQRIDEYETANAKDIITIVEQFKQLPGNGLPFKTYLDNIVYHDNCSDSAKNIKLPEHEGTFFHGDLSTTNIIKTINNKCYLIDPNSKHVFGSWLTDAGKAVFSLIAYEKDYPEAKKIIDHFGNLVLHFAVAEGLRVVKYSPKYISIVNNIADLIQ